MALEAFLIHARNIRDFFATPKRPKPDDVLAADFLGRPIRVRLTRLRSPAMRRRLNKQVAHLSYARSRLSKSWPVGQLMSEINAAMQQFERRLRKIDAGLANIVARGGRSTP
jgi:hypothetical protein